MDQCNHIKPRTSTLNLTATILSIMYKIIKYRLPSFANIDVLQDSKANPGSSLPGLKGLTCMPYTDTLHVSW